MKNTKKGKYILCADVDQLAKNMIDSLGETGSTIDGDRISPYFVLAKGESGEVTVSLVEAKSKLDPSEYHYTVLLVDSVCSDDDYSTLHETKELTLQSLVTLLNEIRVALGDDGAEEERIDERLAKPNSGVCVDKSAEFGFLKSYIQGACFDDEISVDYLYALWIAFCLHNGLTVDKDEYQERLEELWITMEQSEDGEVSHWAEYSDFEYNMSRMLS